MQNRHEEPNLAIRVHTDDVKYFELFRWREALKFWQDKIWTGCFNKGMYPRRPGNAILDIQTRVEEKYSNAYANIVFDSETGLYQATGNGRNLFLARDPRVLCSTNTREGLECAIARFARDRNIQGVILPMTDPRYVRILQLANVRGHIRVGIQQ